MIRSFGFVLVLVLAVAAAPAPAPAQPEAGVLRLGMLQGMFKDIPEVLIQSAAKPFSDMFQKQSGLKGKVEIVSDYELLAARMKDGKLDIGVFHGFEFAWVHERYPELQPLAITIPAYRKVQACLVVSAQSTADSPKDLQGPCVTVPRHIKAHCRLFLERLRVDLPANCCECAKDDSLYADEVLDGIAFNRLTAGLVDISALTAYRHNKPGAFRKLRVLSQSEVFPPAVIAYRSGAIPEAGAAKISQGLARVKDSAEGRPFLMMWQLEGFEAVPTGFDADLKRVAKAYPPPASKPLKVAMPE